MCPVCIATAAWLAAGTGSSGGLGALLLVKKRRPRVLRTDTVRKPSTRSPWTVRPDSRARVCATAASPLA
jgi:hypothetical protein